MRRRGSRTIADRAGLMEGHCPNCGALVDINAGAKCTQCQALLRAGRYDWVLSEITQPSQWRIQRHSDPPGVGQLRGHDPEFSLADLEDRVSVMFWRKSMADRTGKSDPLRKVAAPKALDQCAAHGRGERPDGRIYWADRAVGGVQSMGVIPAAVGQGVERAIVSVRWEGQQFLARSGGRPARIGARGQITTLFILGRVSGTMTDPGQGLSSAHCPNCGAPETNDTTDACEFCGQVCNDGKHGWVLIDLLGVASDQAQAYMRALRMEEMSMS
jgi:hypothetical protein